MNDSLGQMCLMYSRPQYQYLIYALLLLLLVSSIGAGYITNNQESPDGNKVRKVILDTNTNQLILLVEKKSKIIKMMSNSLSVITIKADLEKSSDSIWYEVKESYSNPGPDDFWYENPKTGETWGNKPPQDAITLHIYSVDQIEIR